MMKVLNVENKIFQAVRGWIPLCLFEGRCKMTTISEELEKLRQIGVIVCENEVKRIEDIPLAIWFSSPLVIDQKENIISNTEEQIEISVYNSVKDKLKEMEYKWDSFKKCWKKVFKKEV
jgi:hypothetical protein